MGRWWGAGGRANGPGCGRERARRIAACLAERLGVQYRFCVGGEARGVAGFDSRSVSGERLVGPFVFGLSAFTLIFIATQIISIASSFRKNMRRWWRRLSLFFWDMPQFLLFVIPMAMLLGDAASNAAIGGR